MVGSGFQPGTVSPSSRRADFDLRRRLAALEGTSGLSMVVKGEVPSSANLTGIAAAGAGDLYQTNDTGHIWSYIGPDPNDSITKWIDLGPIEGPTGPQGPPGPQGPAGSGGGGGTDEVFIGPDDPGGTYELWFDTDATAPVGSTVLSYVHNQSAPAAIWVVVHNLGFYPNVFIEDSAGTTVEGEIVFDNTNQLTLSFSAAFAGIAYLS